MKIKTKLIFFYFISIIFLFLAFLFISLFLKDNYIGIKYQRAKDYYDNNKVTIEEYSTYLIDKGFVVTKNELYPFKGDSNLVCHLKDDEIIIYKDSKPVLFAVINKNIVNDTLLIVNILLSIIFIIILIILLLLYKIIKRHFLDRISKLENDLSKFEVGEDFTIISENYNDEINSLEENINDMILKLNLNEKQKLKFAFALSHDLKNPIMKIQAILNMYKKGIKSYEKKEEIVKLINIELNDLIDKINILVEFYKDKNFDNKKEYINIIKNIKYHLKKEIPNIKIIGDNKEFFINADKNKLDIILKNISSNISKYSTKEKVFIEVEKEYVLIKNNILNNNLYKQSGVGNIINDIFAKDMQLKIINRTDDDKYIIKIEKDI